MSIQVTKKKSVIIKSQRDLVCLNHPYISGVRQINNKRRYFSLELVGRVCVATTDGQKRDPKQPL